jgi:hypothetical protein
VRRNKKAVYDGKRFMCWRSQLILLEVKFREALIYSTENKSVLLYYSFSQFSAGKREKQ